MTSTGRKARRRIGALVVVIGVLATACSSSGGSKGSSSSSSAPSAKADPAGIIKVGFALSQEGGTQVFGDPAVAENNATANDALYYLVYGRFMKQNEDGTLTPELAKSGTIIDKNTIELVLRDGLKFSDGTPFDAAAVKAGLERSLAANRTAAFLQPFFSLKAVTVVNPTTVRLSVPDGTAAGWYDTYIAQWQMSITKPGDTSEIPLGAGPMTIVRYDRGQKLVLKKNPSYWNAKNVKVGGYEFIHIANGQAQAGTNALRAGQIDVATIEPSQLPSVTGKLTTYQRVSDRSISMMICKRDGPMANVKARIALNKAIDREAINKVVFKGTSPAATEIWPKGNRFNDPKLNDFLSYDPVAAKKLLQEAGYPNGFELDLFPVEFSGLPETAEVIKQQLAQVGITINIKNGGNYVNDYLIPKHSGLGLVPGGTVGLAKLSFWSGTAIGNQCAYKDPKLDAVVAQLSQVSQSDPKAQELWFEVEKIVVGEALQGFLVFGSQLAAYDTQRIGNIKPLVRGQYMVPDPVLSYVKAS
jgi:peptide/nickel transport system substrate-binding protein